MSKLNSKSLSTLRQKFRRYVREFETEMANYRINPIQQEAEQKEEDPQHVESDQSDSEYINYIFHIVQVMVRDNHLMNNTLPYIYRLSGSIATLFTSLLSIINFMHGVFVNS